MAKVTIHTKNGETIEVEASAEDEAFYDDLPFTSEDVLWTRVRT